MSGFAAKKAMVNYLTKLVQRGVKSIDEIDDRYKELVRENLSGSEIADKNKEEG